MIFKSVEALEEYVLAQCRSAVAEAEQEVYEVIDSCLDQFYGEFTPAEYIRTKQLLHSLVRTGVKPVGNGYVAEVYFDVGRLNYEQGVMPLQHTPQHGMYGWASKTGSEVLDMAMHGSHGGYEDGTAIWDASIAKLGNIWELLKEKLIANGIPIK